MRSCSYLRLFVWYLSLWIWIGLDLCGGTRRDGIPVPSARITRLRVTSQRWFRTRGGGNNISSSSSSNNNNQTEPTTTEENNNEEELSVDDTDPPQLQPTFFSGYTSFMSAFRMRKEAMEELTLTNNSEAEAEIKFNKEEDNIEDAVGGDEAPKPTSTQTRLVGGAGTMTMTHPKPNEAKSAAKTTTVIETVTTLENDEFPNETDVSVAMENECPKEMSMPLSELLKEEEEEEAEALEIASAPVNDSDAVVTKYPSQSSLDKEYEDTDVDDEEAIIDGWELLSPPVDDEPKPAPSFKKSMDAIVDTKQLQPKAAIPVIQPANKKIVVRKDSSTSVSSGYWTLVDRVTTFGLSDLSGGRITVSKPLRPLRKACARATGLHGLVSGKTQPKKPSKSINATLNEETLGYVRRRLRAIERARGRVLQEEERQQGRPRRGRGRGRDVLRNKRKNLEALEKEELSERAKTLIKLRKVLNMKEDFPEHVELRQPITSENRQRVMEIDRQIRESASLIERLQCEKDLLQRRPNPLFNYTNATSAQKNDTADYSRKSQFPSPQLVEDYIEGLRSSGRLSMLNHTHLWLHREVYHDEVDDLVGGEKKKREKDQSGSWLLRQSLLGNKYTLGEKLGETVEEATYRAVCSSFMSVLAGGVSSLHGTNVLGHADVRLGLFAQEKSFSDKEEDYFFFQKDAVAETLLSHCQTAAPLLKLFPIAWQRAMLCNLLVLVSSIMRDFCRGFAVEVLGHRLTLEFRPLAPGDYCNRKSIGRRNLPDNLELSIKLTSQDLARKWGFLGRWHHRALGSGLLHAQVGHLVARLVLTLVDDVLDGLSVDLWSSRTSSRNKPKHKNTLVASLEPRTTFVESASSSSSS